MPKSTPFKAMSRSEQAAYRASLPKPAPKAAPDRTVRVGPPPAKAPDGKDGLLWLVKKKRLNAKQVREALYYRDLVRSACGGPVKVSDLFSSGGGSKGGGVVGGEYGDQASALELYIVRQHVLGGEDDLLTVMDGVCGRERTVRELAAGDQLRSHELLSALRIALNLMVNNRETKEAALAGKAAKKAA
jgi:hypothetical protein